MVYPRRIIAFSRPSPRRVVAAVSLDASMVLELLSPLAPAYFLLIASVANIGESNIICPSLGHAGVGYLCALVVDVSTRRDCLFTIRTERSALFPRARG